jgi:hypothetical protein
MRAQVRVALCGALGGGINAWLCYARLPVTGGLPAFKWHVIPAGAIHGGVLAVTPFAAGLLLRLQGLRTRLAAALPVAWLAGFVAWIPLNRSAFDDPWPKSLRWALSEGWGSALLGPLQFFGLVALLYYLVVALSLARETRALHVVAATVAGVVGSLWFWITIGPWYFSLLHGAIWGMSVGVGAAVSRCGSSGEGVA